MTANPATASGYSRQGGRGGSVAGGGMDGGVAPSTLPEEYDVDPSQAGAHLRGQIFRTGVSLGFALSFLIGGFTLAYGIEELTAVVIALSSFGFIVVLSFFAEVIVEPSLERVATEREEERMERERDIMPTAGGVMTASLSLTGGSRPSNGMAATLPPLAGGGIAGHGSTKGHALDITLPEENAAPPPRAAAGMVGGSRPPARPTAAVAAPLAARSVGAAARGGAGTAGVGGQSPEASQDLASLLREASQPSPVAVRSR
jgi:hypothetical protein